MAECDRPSPPGAARLSNLHDANWSCVLKSSFSLFSRNSPSVFHGHPNSTRQPLLSSKEDSSHLFPTSGAHPPLAPSNQGGPIPRANQHPKSRWLMERLPQLPGLRGQVGESSTPSCKLSPGPRTVGLAPAAAWWREGAMTHAGVRGVCWNGLRHVFSSPLAGERCAATSSCKEMNKQSETGPWKYVSR